MPAVSQKQAAFMGMCEHSPQHARGKCPNMTKKQFHDFAATPRKGLPKKTGSPTKSGPVSGY